MWCRCAAPCAAPCAGPQEDLTTGALKFSLNPKKGLQYLETAGMLESPLSASDVAAFLHLHQASTHTHTSGMGKKGGNWGCKRGGR